MSTPHQEPSGRPAVRSEAPSGREVARMLLGEPAGEGGPGGPRPGGFLGGAPAYPLIVLFGLALAEATDRATSQVLLPDIRDAFALSNSGILAIAGVTAIVALVLTIPIAVLADRTSRVRLMLAGAAVFALFSLGTSMVGVWVLPMSWVFFLVMRCGAGVGLATVFPTHNSLLADFYDVPYRPRVYALHRAAESLGIFLGFIVAGQLAEAFGWRAPFLVLAVPTFVMIAIGWRLREPVRGRFERRAMGAHEEVIEAEEPPPSFEEAVGIVRRVRTLRRIFSAVPFFAVAFIGFGSLANLFYEEEFGLGAAQRGLYDAIAELGQLAGLVVASVVGTRLVRRDPALVIRFVSIVAFASAALAAGFALAPNVATAVACRIALAAALAAVLPSIFAAMSLTIPPRARSSGFAMAAVYVVPGLAALPLVGWVSDHLGIRTGMLVMTPVFVVGGCVVSSAHKYLDADIRNVWRSTAARSELLVERAEGRIKQLLVRGVEVSYGDVQVLFGVDLEVDQGEVVALLGTNGAGKSTLLKAITGVVGADHGAIVFEGRDITHAPAHEIAALGVAMVPGGQGVFASLTVAENLKVASWLDRRAGTPSARRRGTATRDDRLREALELFPELRPRLADHAGDLSGGQQQMLALAMALLGSPKLLLIDELSLGLSPAVVSRLLEVVRAAAARGTTVILVEQSVNLALELAGSAYFMEKGEIRFRGPTSELLDRPDVLRSVFLEGAVEALRGSAPPVAAEAPRARSRAPEPAPLAPAGIAAAPALELDAVSVHFGGIAAVDGVSLRAEPGEIVGLIGPNGAGKTTLFDAVSGFAELKGGSIRIGETDVTRWGPDARARCGLGRSFQDAMLFPAMTVTEIISVALERSIAVKDPLGARANWSRPTGVRLWRLRRQTPLSHGSVRLMADALNAALRMPVQQRSEWALARRAEEIIEVMGLGAHRASFAHELSTGTRRIVDLACVLAHSPSVVLLDEPSTGIAQREAEALGPLILRLRDVLGACVLIIEHDIALVSALSDRLVALDQGRVVASGSPAEVLAEPAVIASYLGDGELALARSGPRPDFDAPGGER